VEDFCLSLLALSDFIVSVADAKMRGNENEISFLTEKFVNLHKKAITSMSLYTYFLCRFPRKIINVSENIFFWGFSSKYLFEKL
jgi:hypothetical protein